VSQAKLSPATGVVCRQANRLFLEVDGKLYQIHLWDVEQCSPRPKTTAEGILFHFKKPVAEGRYWVHGWVYPGTLKILEAPDRKRRAGRTPRSSQTGEEQNAKEQNAGD